MSIIRPSFCHGIVDLFYCCFPQEIVKVGRHVEVPTRKEGDTQGKVHKHSSIYP